MKILGMYVQDVVDRVTLHERFIIIIIIIIGNVFEESRLWDLMQSTENNRIDMAVPASLFSSYESAARALQTIARVRRSAM